MVLSNAVVLLAQESVLLLAGNIEWPVCCLSARRSRAANSSCAHKRAVSWQSVAAALVSLWLSFACDLSVRGVHELAEAGAWSWPRLALEFSRVAGLSWCAEGALWARLLLAALPLVELHTWLLSTCDMASAAGHTAVSGARRLLA